MSYGWAIISTGLHGDTKIAPAIGAVPDAELVAVLSQDRERAAQFAERHGARAAYDSVDALLGDPRVEAVFVCSPNALHAGHARAAAGAGRHVLTEKPMATTLEDAVEMVRACREAGVKLGVGFHLRQHPGHREGRRIVADGGLGTVTLAQGQWGFGVRGQVTPPARPPLRRWWEDPALIGGASTMMGTGIHVVDLMRFVLGREITDVAAVSDGQTGDQALEQMLAMSLRFEGGAVGTICCGRRLPDSRNDFDVYGSGGRLSGIGTLAEGRKGRLEVVSEAGDSDAAYGDDLLANYVDEIVDFQRAIAEEREPAASGIDGLRVVQVTLAMIESARQRRTVSIEPMSL